MKEFNLSDKVHHHGEDGEEYDPYYLEEDIKEFIKKLKEKQSCVIRDEEQVRGKIFMITEFELDKLAGEKLC